MFVRLEKVKDEQFREYNVYQATDEKRIGINGVTPIKVNLLFYVGGRPYICPITAFKAEEGVFISERKLEEVILG